jgi:PBP1b-binding outer membrane lipoprotein LpoB
MHKAKALRALQVLTANSKHILTEKSNNKEQCKKATIKPKAKHSPNVCSVFVERQKKYLQITHEKVATSRMAKELFEVYGLLEKRVQPFPTD